MTTAQVVETSVTVNNSPIQDYVHPDDQTQPFDMTPGFKPFTVITSKVGKYTGEEIAGRKFRFEDYSVMFTSFQRGLMIGSLLNELENGEDLKVKGVRKVGGAGKRNKERLSSTRGNVV